MGRRNFLIEGVSCTGKTTVCKALQRRGYQAIDGISSWRTKATRRQAPRQLTGRISTTFGE